MKFLSVIIFCFLFLMKNNYGQELDRCWPLGTTTGQIPRQQCNLVFVGNTVGVDTVYRDIKFSGTCVSISDSLGNVKFFNNGCVIGNVNNDTMLNGNDLNPGACPATTCPNTGIALGQASIVIPDPGDPNKYLIFHESCELGAAYRPIYLLESIIDMTLDGGRGEVIVKNRYLLADTLCTGSLTAVKHANGIDWWLVSHERNGNGFIKFLITASGVTGPIYQNTGPTYNDDGHGTSKFSPDGNWYASSTQLGGIDLYNFNRCNGELNNRIYIDLPDSLWTNYVEFSPNSRFLYSNWLYSISQFDLYSSDIPLSRQIVAIYDGFLDSSSIGAVDFCCPQLAPNGKIYIANLSGTHYMHVIDQPDSLGVACNVLQHAIRLPSTNQVVPNFPNYRLGALDSLYCDTVNSVIDFYSKRNNILVYPNPSLGLVQIESKNANEQIVSVSIFDNLSQEINCNIDHENLIDVRLVPDGLYFLKIITNQNYYSKQLIILK